MANRKGTRVRWLVTVHQYRTGSIYSHLRMHFFKGYLGRDAENFGYIKIGEFESFELKFQSHITGPGVLGDRVEGVADWYGATITEAGISGQTGKAIVELAKKRCELLPRTAIGVLKALIVEREGGLYIPDSRPDPLCVPSTQEERLKLPERWIS